MTIRRSYTARAVRDGAWWAIEVPEVEGVFTQARRIDQVVDTAREAVALLLDVAPDSFDLSLDVKVPPAWADLLEEVRKAKSDALAAYVAASSATRRAVVALQAAGLPVRDVGALLGVSAQRVSQLANSKRRGSLDDIKVMYVDTRSPRVGSPRKTAPRRAPSRTDTPVNS